MDFWSLLLVAIGLAMDAFAVSICKGLSQKKLYIKTMLIVGGWFGIFQGLMPLLGYYLSSIFSADTKPVMANNATKVIKSCFIVIKITLY